MASKAQRAVTGVPPQRWAQLGKALQEHREDVLGYKVRGRFAADRGVNIRLVQDLEKNYRPGTYTRWALQDAARAYEVPYCPWSPDHPEGGPGSILAFLRGEEDALARDEAAGTARKRPAVVIEVPALPPAPMDDPAREAAARPYAEAIWKRFLQLPRNVADPSAAHLGLAGDDAKIFSGSGVMDLGDRIWLVADIQRLRDARGGNSGEGAAGA